MKGLLTVFAVSGTLIMSGQLAAHKMVMDPYVGLDYKYRSMSSKDTNAYNLGGKFKKKYHGADLFVGAKWHENWGVELGYESSGRKSKTYTFAAGEVLNGVRTAGDQLTTKNRLRGPHVNLNGYMPVNRCWEAVGQLGVGFLKSKVDASFTPNGGAAVNLNPQNNSSRAVWRLGVGGQYMASKMISLRGLVRWENTSRFKLDLNNVAGTAITDLKPFKNSTSLALGVYLKF